MKKTFPIRAGSNLPLWVACAATGLASVALAQDDKASSDTPKQNEKAKSAEEAPKAETDYRNWFDVSIGGNLIKGNAAQFKERHQVPQGVYGGVSDFHYEQDVGKKGLFEVDGRGIFDNHDYSLRINLQNPDYGYIRGG